MILVKTKHKNQNYKPLAIVKIFKNRYHYFEIYRYKVFILKNNNNFGQFIYIRNMNLRQLY